MIDYIRKNNKRVSPKIGVFCKFCKRYKEFLFILIFLDSLKCLKAPRHYNDLRCKIACYLPFLFFFYMFEIS